MTAATKTRLAKLEGIGRTVCDIVEILNGGRRALRVGPRAPLPPATHPQIVRARKRAGIAQARQAAG